MKRIIFFSLLLFSMSSTADSWQYIDNDGYLNCPYMDDQDGNVFLAYGNSMPDSYWNDCMNNGSKKRAIANKNEWDKNAIREFRFNGYIATSNNIDGTVVLSCYTGAISSNKISHDNRIKRMHGLIKVHDRDQKEIERIKKAFYFGTSLRDKYPLDTQGTHTARVCDSMVISGKL